MSSKKMMITINMVNVVMAIAIAKIFRPDATLETSITAYDDSFLSDDVTRYGGTSSPKATPMNILATPTDDALDTSSSPNQTADNRGGILTTNS